MINLVIPAAGEATRLRPLSSNMSKVMVRVNGKPCLDYIIEQAKKLAQNQNDELGEIIVVDGKFNDIREYCEKKHPYIKFVRQEELTGPLDACRLGLMEIEDPVHPVVIWLGDAIILDDDIPFGSDCLVTKEVDDHENWCMWDNANNAFYDKPSEHIDFGVALVGLYSFDDGEGAIRSFEKSSGYDISNALEMYEYPQSPNSRFACHVTDEWYDIGDVKTYYKTCAKLLNLKSREFNTLEYDEELGVIRKKPNYHSEHAISALLSEKYWYECADEYMKVFVPRKFDFGDTDLVLSYESGILLSDLMLYDNLSESFWEYIINKVMFIKAEYFEDLPSDESFIKSFRDDSRDMWYRKTRTRIANVGFTEDEEEYICDLASELSKTVNPIKSMHGDLHFGNILYNPHNDQIRLLDPRGQYGKWEGINGDDLYDWAKLSHDLIFGYNALLANVPRNETVRSIAIQKFKDHAPHCIETILAGGAVLLASAISLHADSQERQERFIAEVRKYIHGSEDYRF